MQEMKTGQQVWRGEGVLSEQVWTGLGGEAGAGAGLSLCGRELRG